MATRAMSHSRRSRKSSKASDLIGKIKIVVDKPDEMWYYIIRKGNGGQKHDKHQNT